MCIPPEMANKNTSSCDLVVMIDDWSQAESSLTDIGVDTQVQLSDQSIGPNRVEGSSLNDRDMDIHVNTI